VKTLTDIMLRNAARELLKQSREIARKVAKVRGLQPLMPGNDFMAALELAEDRWGHEVEILIAKWRQKRSTYEPLFSMPPARRPKVVKTGKTLTLVERRAASAKRKVREWQRKSKLASTKIKQYRKKVSYYTKKGVIQ
jgi:hypothetical protein